VRWRAPGLPSFLDDRRGRGFGPDEGSRRRRRQIEARNGREVFVQSHCLVIAGLDPAIQRFVTDPNKALDARVKPAHDDVGSS
jgi:hypothetical protein